MKMKGNKEEAMLAAVLAAIRPADRAAMEKASAYLDSLAKPPRSLGKLETLAIRLAGMTGQVHNQVKKRRILVFCADNGICEEGVSSAPQSVTLAQTVNLTRGLTGASCLAKHFGDELRVIDVGVMSEVPCEAVINKKVACGTKNFLREPAMTRQQALEALKAGVEQACIAKAEGVEILGVGEMGIGNTTTSSAVLAALTGLSPEKVTGRGGGLTDDAFDRKKQVVAAGLELHRPDPADPIDVLAKVGGFDLCAMCGAFLGAAAERLPVVIDGFISVVAALCAARLCPDARDYMIASHVSFERGYLPAVKELGLEPFLQMDMRLGEGSGCPLAFLTVEAACAVMNEMATFEQAAIDDGYLADIRRGDAFTVKERGKA
ncbi:MAG: nicotinate-nucleotide--dimethylbenzimidazole phosphoribosyltransferase [Clostridia bacterium]|nr:nicotinate-nucleotide--dimethylbenzimidazole phosphoribosyltransferase [Clostridia bacterium]